MRKITIITIFLLNLFVFCFILFYPPNGAKSMERKGWNRLKKLYFTPRPDLIVGTCSSEPNGSIRFWSTDGGELKEVLYLGKGEWATSLAVSNDGCLIVVGLLAKNQIVLYSLKENRWLWKVNWVEKGLVGNPIRFTPDDRKLVVLGARNIVTYDAKTSTILQRLEDSKGFSGGFPNDRTRNHAISLSARYGAFWQGYIEHDEGWWSSRNIWVLVLDIETGKIVAKQGKIQEKYKNCSATFTPDEKGVVLGSMDGYMRVWSIADQRVVRRWRAYGAGEEPLPFEEMPFPNSIDSMTFSPEGRHLATMGHLKGGFNIRIWDYSSNKLIHEFVDVISSSLPMCSGYPMAFSPEGKYFAFERQGKLCLYDVQTWQEKWCVPSWPEGRK